MLDAPAFSPILSLVDRAFDISIQTRHNFYDCLYVALAEREGCVTAISTVLPLTPPPFWQGGERKARLKEGGKERRVPLLWALGSGQK